MMAWLRKRRPTLFFLLALGLPLLLHWALSADIHSARIIAANGTPVAPQNIDLPLLRTGEATKRLTDYSAVIEKNLLQSAAITIVADDCIRALEVNEKTVPLEGKNVCNWKNGIALDLSQHLVNGTNTLRVLVENIGGDDGIDIYPSPLGLGYMGWLLTYSLLLFALLCLQVMRDDKTSATIIVLASALLLGFMLQRFYEPPYTHDVGSHRGTILHYSQNLTIPPVDSGWHNYQPPLYYFMAGAIHRYVSAFAADRNGRLAAALLNHIFYSLFLLYGALTIKKTVQSNGLQKLGIAALVLWPTGILHASRFTNDVLLYLSFAGCIYHFICWQNDRVRKHFSGVLLWLAVAFATKNSAAILAAGLFVVSLYNRTMLSALGQCISRRNLPFIVPLCLALALGLGRTLSYSIGTPNTTLLEGKPNMPAGLKFLPAERLTLDYENVLSVPYNIYHAPANPSRAHIFWNFFVRTMSFGEYEWNGTTHASLANFALIWMLASFTLALLLRDKRSATSIAFRTNVLMFGLCVAALFISRIYFINQPHSGDVRHMHPLVIFFLASYLFVVEAMRTRGTVLWLPATALLCLYVAVSAFHAYLQLDWTFWHTVLDSRAHIA